MKNRTKLRKILQFCKFYAHYLAKKVIFFQKAPLNAIFRMRFSIRTKKFVRKFAYFKKMSYLCMLFWRYAGKWGTIERFSEYKSSFWAVSSPSTIGSHGLHSRNGSDRCFGSPHHNMSCVGDPKKKVRGVNDVCRSDLIKQKQWNTTITKPYR